VSTLALFGPFIFMLAGAVLLFLLSKRARRMSSRERNAVVTAIFGLFLCGKYTLLIDQSDKWVRVSLEWIWVIGIGGMMVMLAYANLGSAKREANSATR